MSSAQGKCVMTVVLLWGVLFADSFSSMRIGNAREQNEALLSSLPTPSATQTRGRYNGKIVFSSDRSNSGLSIWSMNPDGSQPLRLTDGKNRSERLHSTTHVYDTGPTWSSDGTKIAFISNRSGLSGLYTMRADGSNVQLLTDQVPNPGGAAWSPDGTKIAFSAGSGIVIDPNQPFTDIFLLNADGTGVTRLTNGPGLNTAPSWSPDGRQIAFASNRDPDGRFKIWLMNSDGSNQRRLTTIHNTNNASIYNDHSPSWSPDGAKILHGGSRDFNGLRDCQRMNCSELFVTSVDGSNERQITSDPNRGGIFLSSKWSPDGTKIVTSLRLGTISDVRNSIDRGRAIFVMNADGTNQVNISNRGKYDFNTGEYAFYDDNPDWQPLLTQVNSTSSLIGFDLASYVVSEGAGQVAVSVGRTGDLSEGASCFYVTQDDTATAKRDYSPVLGTLRFAAGESSRSIRVPLVDNGDAYGSRSFKVVLSDNEGSAALSAYSKEATITILDTDTFPRPSNPIDQARTFVRMHYVDFLNREPDDGGWDYWTGQINSCATDQSCVLSRRIGVSAAFFIEQEFQQTGSFVFRFKLINRPYSAFNFLAFLRDVQSIGADPATLEANKAAYIEKYFNEDRVAVSWGRTNTEYVDLLFHYVQLFSGASLPLSDRDAFVAGLNSGTETRASVCKKVIDHQLFKDAAHNSAFVQMQYYGYLRREPDPGGYDFWLNVLNNREPNNFRGMVCAFITSAEYQLRFGSVVSRSNRDC